MKHILDFSLLPDLSYAHFVLDFYDDIEHSMSVFKDTYERAEGARLFLSAYGSIGCPRTKQQSEAFLRASLAEFVSMEDAIKRDLKKSN